MTVVALRWPHGDTREGCPRAGVPGRREAISKDRERRAGTGAAPKKVLPVRFAVQAILTAAGLAERHRPGLAPADLKRHDEWRPWRSPSRVRAAASERSCGRACLRESLRAAALLASRSTRPRETGRRAPVLPEQRLEDRGSAS